MNNQYILLRRKRELGEILSHGFNFIRQNSKTIGRILLRFVGPFFLLQIIMASVYSYSSTEILDGSIGSGFSVPDSFFTNFSLAIVGFVLTSLLFYAMLNGAIFSMFKSYLRNEGQINFEEVSQNLKKKWPALLGAAVVIVVFGLLGAVIIAIPFTLVIGGFFSAILLFFLGLIGILAFFVFVAMPLSLVYPIMIFDEVNVFKAFADAYRYLKGNWVMTFLTLVVIYLITIFINSIFQVPLMVYMFFQQLSGGGVSMDFGSDWVLLGLSLIAQIFRYIIAALVPILTAFIYFNLHERKHQTGTYQEIESIGPNDNPDY